jgi:hypothetical protein
MARLIRVVVAFFVLLVGVSASLAPAGAASPSGLNGTTLTNQWKPLGIGPLRADDPTYGNTFGDGFVNLEGRVSDYTWDGAHSRLYAAVASGGVWASTDRGKTWHSIGESLPTQTIGSLVYSTSNGGTLLALSGDNAFGGTTYAGLGAFWTTDGGAHWNRSAGLPSGAQGFKITVDPGHQNVVYAATGFGLFRSIDTGLTFVNANLPTGACHGHSELPGCFLANIVTDVAVRGSDTFEHTDGAVLAAVGWRAGARKSFGTTIESPQNGLYYSDSGAPGSFTFENAQDNIGFANQKDIGRVALGPAIGATQNHDYIYAAVQDATLFNKGTVEGLDVPATADPLLGLCATCTPTYFNGVYVSADFGKTWTLVANRNDFQDPANGSTLATLQPLGFGPGIQSWYDLWIKPDPTRTSGGVPTRLDVGLEEIYENRDTLLPQNKRTTFRAVGPYNANGGACILVALASTCGTKQGIVGATTTHPDQHGAIWIPGPDAGAVTLVVGNDGGNYTQQLPSGAETSQAGFGNGDQAGFNTLLPYGVDIANDNTVVAGLQDNGELRIDHETGKQNMVYGGDGIFTVIDPVDSKTIFEETPDAGISISTDGGVTWHSGNPLSFNPSFYAPLKMDPANSKHLVTGGRLVEETTDGSATTSGNTDVSSATSTTNGWINVFELGTFKHPGVAPPTDDFGNPIVPADDVQNQIQAMGVQGAAMYAGFCGDCDPIRDNFKFHGGLATNVGGNKPPKTRTSDGWHFAAARGLPQRMITSITVDPTNTRTVYVTLGTSSERPWAPAGAQAGDGLDQGTGQVFKSINAGDDFVDISGNLPTGGGQWTVLHGDQLLVATVSGVYASVSPISAAGAHAATAHAVTQPTYVTLGQGLPAAPVYSMTLKHNDPNTLVVASLGRGIYRYSFLGADQVTPVTPVTGATGGTPNTGRGVLVPRWLVLALAGAAVLLVGGAPTIAIALSRRDR